MSTNRRVKRGIKKVIVKNENEGIQDLINRQRTLTANVDKTMTEMVEKHNNMAAKNQAIEELMSKVVTLTAGQLGQLEAKQHAVNIEFDRSMAGIDRNVLALAEMTKELFGHIAQADQFFKRLAAAANISLALTDEQSAQLREEAAKWYHDVTVSAFETVRLRLEEDQKERSRQAEAELLAKQEAEKAAKDLSEADRMMAGFQQAEGMDRAMVAQLGGSGSDIPEGADVFGGG